MAKIPSDRPGLDSLSQLQLGQEYAWCEEQLARDDIDEMDIHNLHSRQRAIELRITS